MSIFDKSFTVKDIGASYRMVNHWSSLGVISEHDGKGWRRFTAAEAVWLKIVLELRQYGVTLPVMARLKKAIYDNMELQIAVRKADKGEDMFFIFTLDNKCGFANSEKIAEVFGCGHRPYSTLFIRLLPILESLAKKK